MPPSEADGPERLFWHAALAVLRRHGTVLRGETNHEYQVQDYPRWGAPARRTEVILDLQVRLAERMRPADAHELELAVATLLAERLGMRLMPAQAVASVAPTPPPIPPPPPPPRPAAADVVDLDDAAARFMMMELD